MIFLAVGFALLAVLVACAVLLMVDDLGDDPPEPTYCRFGYEPADRGGESGVTDRT